LTVRVAAYIRPRGFVNPTGVGKHQIHMVTSLAAASGVNLSLLASRQELEEFGAIVPRALRDLPLTAVALSRRTLEWMWVLGSFPSAERWCGDVDWVYCPFEVFVPTRAAKFAATIHGMHWFEKNSPWYSDPAVRGARRRLEPFFRKIVERADLILAVSEFLKERLCGLFQADPSKVAVVGNGVEEEFFVAGRQPPRTWEALTASPYVLAIMALEARKGAECILEVARALHRAAPNVRVVVAGGNCGVSPYVEEGLTIPNLELRGYVGNPDLVGLMQGALALLYPSHYETFGIPAVEAMACGTPVIAANVAGLPEVVGEAGILIDPSHSEEVVDAVCALLRDPTLRESYRNAGLRRAEDFTWDKCAGRALAAMRRRG